MEFTRESVFISAIRAFFKTFAVLLGIAVAFLVIALGFTTVSNSVELPDKSKLTLEADADWNQKLLTDSTPVILKINVTGIIGTSNMKTSKFKQMMVDSRSGVLAKNRVKGILLYINSPGGSAVDSAGIFHLLKTYKEKYHVPIYAYVEGLCASGGMYIACAADKIVATADSTIGSVGVRLGPAFNFSTAMEKIGIAALTLTEGKNKDALNPFRPWKEGEDDALQAVIAGDYVQFVNAVTNNRPRLDKEKLINEYGANVYIATKAQELGYIDESNATYDETLRDLVKAANLEGSYQVLQIEPYQSVLKELAENKNALLSKKILYLYSP